MTTNHDLGPAGIGAALIAAERRHAIEECGYDAAHDAQHTPEQLEEAASAYLYNAPHLWPFTDGFKPNLPYRRRLIIAGQFLAAALDRLAVIGLHPTEEAAS